MVKRASVVLTDTLFAKLSFLADMEDKLVGEVLRDSVRFYLDEDNIEIDWESVDYEGYQPQESEQKDEDETEELPPPPDDK